MELQFSLPNAEPLRYCEWDYCTKSFRTREELLRHVKIHVLEAVPVDEDSQEFESYLPPRFDSSTVASTSAVPAPTSGPASVNGSAAPMTSDITPAAYVSSNETPEGTQSQSNPLSIPITNGANPMIETEGSGELPAPVLSAPPASIPIVAPPESQHMTQFSQPMDMEGTQDAPSPPAQIGADFVDPSATLDSQMIGSQAGAQGERAANVLAGEGPFTFGFSQQADMNGMSQL